MQRTLLVLGGLASILPTLLLGIMLEEKLHEFYRANDFRRPIYIVTGILGVTLAGMIGAWVTK